METFGAALRREEESRAEDSGTVPSN